MEHSRKTIALLLLLCVMAASLSACSSGGTANAEPTRLSFKSAASYDYLKTLNGQQVTINGYMATSSPADGSFIFLMNLPYQSCPFCKPNTSQLSNTMEVYPKKNQTFSYNTNAIKVTGKLQVAPSETENFTDPFGYEFNFKIVDAEYVIIRDEDMTAEIALWQKIADSGVITDIYAMYDYVNFTVDWPSYFVNGFTDASGNAVPGYYLYPADAMGYLTNDGSQWNYGYKDGYFEGIIKKVQSLDPTAFEPLVMNIRSAQALAKKAIKELEDGNYTSEKKYLEKFSTEDYVFTLNKGEALRKEMDALYLQFTDWLGTWEV